MYRILLCDFFPGRPFGLRRRLDRRRVPPEATDDGPRPYGSTIHVDDDDPSDEIDDTDDIPDAVDLRAERFR